MATNITAITASATTNGRQGPRQFQGVFDVIPFKVTLTDASLAAQVAGQTDVTVNGAAVGDLVLFDMAVDRTGIMVDGYVSAANTVTLTTFNVEGTDANTTMSGGVVAKGVVLKFKDNIWAKLD